jgi:hypothetical protein
MRKIDLHATPLMLAFVLGGILERSLRQSLLISLGSPLNFFSRPISAALLVLAIILLLISYGPFFLGANKAPVVENFKKGESIMYGWRARIGLLIPSVNTTMEPEFNRMAPEGVSVHAMRLGLSGFTPEDLIAMGKEAGRAAKMVLDVGPEVIVFGCTSGSFVKGVGHDQELVKEIESATGRPAIATSQAVLEALHYLNMKSVAVATPLPG